MEFQIEPDDIDSTEKHDAFVTLFGEDTYDEFVSGEGEDEDLPDGQMYREEFEDLPQSERKAFIDGGGTLVDK